MKYTEHHARRYLAQKLYDHFMEKPHGWLDMSEMYRRHWERDIEVLLDPKDERVIEALVALGWLRADGSA